METAAPPRQIKAIEWIPYRNGFNSTVENPLGVVDGLTLFEIGWRSGEKPYWVTTPLPGFKSDIRAVTVEDARATAARMLAMFVKRITTTAEATVADA